MENIVLTIMPRIVLLFIGIIIVSLFIGLIVISLKEKKKRNTKD